jgi:hypothetical protein
MLLFLFALVLVPLTTPQEPANPLPTASGRIALLARHVEALDEPERFGNRGGWKQSSENVRYEAGAHGVELVVEALVTLPGYHHEYLRLRLGETGASGEAFFSMDVPHPPLVDLSGVAVLLTDGEDSCVEYEITCSMGVDWFEPYFARIHLGELGVPIASALVAGTRGSAIERFHEQEQNLVRTADGIVRSAGHVDSWNRRQGVWTLHDEQGELRLESTWRDGRLTGLLTSWDAAGRRRRVESLIDGFPDGLRYQWSESGELYSLDEYVGGRAHGLRVVFRPGGRKRLEMQFEGGVGVGRRKEWDEHGKLLQDEPNRSGLMFGPDTALQAAQWSVFRGEIAAFYTRRE